MQRHIYIPALLIPAFLMASGCSEHSRPDSPEPTLRLVEAAGITRREATVRAAIDRHGGPELTYTALRYGEASADPDAMPAIEADPSLTAFEFSLTDLRPGTRYSCRLEAGTPTALLVSDTISFTTVPNDMPTVSAITPVATGPLGIMARFSIPDDGGEPLTEAGCEVKREGSPESRRIYVTDLNPLPEYLQLSITGLSPATSYTIVPFASNSRGETRGEALEYTTVPSTVLTEPGMLESLFTDGSDSSLDRLTIAGPMNGDDFRTLRAMLGAPGDSDIRLRISGIDLSDAEITEGGGSYDGQRFTEADRLTTGLFADCTLLRDALLPNSATALDRDAFARCPALETITIPARTETLLPSADCPALSAIEVSAANPRFISLDGVLLNADASQILWFPCGKTGEYSFPATITAIGENAFAGTSITALHIPPTVTVISRGAFAGSSLREIRLPDNITNVYEGMFQNCTALTTVRLGTATEFIGDYAFDGTDLTDLYVGAEYPPYANTEAFTNRLKILTEECTLHVPAGSRKLYRSNAKWGRFNKIEEF